MPEQITWTHVDKLVRKMLDERGMLQSGVNAAEVTYNLIKFLERSLTQAELCADSRGATVASLQRQLKEAQQAPKLGKTKQRLDALEKEVNRIRKTLAYLPPVAREKCCDIFPDCMHGMGADGL